MRQVFTAEPYKRYSMHLPVQTTQAGEMRLRVYAGDGEDHDALEVPLLVAPPRNQALRVAATSGTPTPHEGQETIVFPPATRPNTRPVI